MLHTVSSSTGFLVSTKPFVEAAARKTEIFCFVEAVLEDHSSEDINIFLQSIHA
jgi:hypothetical protein